MLQLIVGITFFSLSSLIIYICFLKSSYTKQLASLEFVLDQVINKNFSSNELVYQEGQESKIMFKAKRIAEMNHVYAEQVFEAQHKIQEIVADISHQMKTPIAGILMYLELLEGNGLTQEEQVEFLQRMGMDTDRLRWLTEEFLNIARFEMKTLAIVPRNGIINLTIQQAIQQINPQATQKNCTFYLRTKESFELSYDEKWMCEAISNVLDNAVKYSFESTAIEISIEKLISYTQIKIENVGAPILKEELPKIFKKYYRGTNSHSQEGVGIGLYLTKLIIESHNGYLLADSRNNTTTVSIFLQN